MPDGPVTGLAEEFRLIKRQLLADIEARHGAADDRRRSVLICSAQPNEGKTFCAINLALSLAGERDVEVLLVDGDFPKPDVLATLGIARRRPGPGRRARRSVGRSRSLRHPHRRAGPLGPAGGAQSQ